MKRNPNNTTYMIVLSTNRLYDSNFLSCKNIDSNNVGCPGY